MYKWMHGQSVLADPAVPVPKGLSATRQQRLKCWRYSEHAALVQMVLVLLFQYPGM